MADITTRPATAECTRCWGTGITMRPMDGGYIMLFGEAPCPVCRPTPGDNPVDKPSTRE